MSKASCSKNAGSGLAVFAILGALLLAATEIAAGDDHAASPGGAFTCDFGLSPIGLPQDKIAPSIERDRMYMAARPGLLHKHIPISFDAAGNVFSGGRYLFDTARHAREYRDWVLHSYVLDGVPFLKRPYFLSPECHAWTVIGAHDFADAHSSQTVLRTERWSVRNVRRPASKLEQRFDAVLAEARARGLTSVWLLYDEEEALASLVYFASRVGPSDPRQPDFASLGTLADAPPLGAVFDDQGWRRIFDRTQWALTIWFPFAVGDRGEPALWPNTPPFVLPLQGDGVCEVSRGESAANAPEDCPPQCGDGIAQTGETSMTCPGDVRLFQ